MLTLFGLIFLNLIISIYLIINGRKKDRQNEINISSIRNCVIAQEKQINSIVAELTTKINNISFELSKTIKSIEDNVKKSFEKAASHVNSINQDLISSKKALNDEINGIGTLLQELKIESDNKSKEYNKIIGDIENKISSIIIDYNELKWQIENLTKIEEDSKRLNEDIDDSQQEALIEAIVNEINANKDNIETEQKDNDLPEIIYGVAPKSTLKAADENVEADKNYQEKTSSREEEVLNKNSLSEQITSVEPESKSASKQRFYGDGVSLDEEQAKALDCIENTTGNYFITGKAGTGKSFLLKIFQTLTKKTILKVAPTGIAALNIDGVTMHSAFGYDNLTNISLDSLDEKTLTLSPNKKLVLKNIDTLIIDEISMVRADIFDKMDKILRIICQKENLPFGGKQVLVFGDLFQLPPIANKTEEKYLKHKYGGIFFFNSDSYKNSNFSYIELRTNHRQKGDQVFFDILNKIREGTMTDADINLVNGRYVEDNNNLRRVIKLYPKRSLADRVNEDALNKIWGDERVYNAEVTFKKYADQNLSIENNFQISATLKLKIGAMVMMTRNDVGHRWVNGTLGIVEKFGDNTIFVQINGNTYEIYRVEFEMNEAKYENGNITYTPVFKAKQFPMVLAYAITIHKSQGSTYQQIACDPSDCFAPGQAYVALSRCVDLNGVHLLKKLNSTDIKVNNQVKEFYLSNRYTN